MTQSKWGRGLKIVNYFTCDGALLLGGVTPRSWVKGGQGLTHGGDSDITQKYS